MAKNGNGEPAPGPITLPVDVKADVDAFTTAVLLKGVNSDVKQEVYLDGNRWKIHAYRMNDETIILRVVNKGK